MNALNNSQLLSADELTTLQAVQQRVLWLATNMIHHANHIRPNPDQSKVGGHQASSASMVTIMTALYFHHLNQGDLVSVKPHASPIFHSIQYLLGQLSRNYLPTLRQFGGLQAYPSRSKDPDRVDFSTGSVGLGAVAPIFASLSRRYASRHFEGLQQRRFIGVIGDAELDEGNIWEALLDDVTNNLQNVLLIVDLNRQSLDRVVPGIKAARLKEMFVSCGWQTLEAKFGRRLQALFDRPNGQLLQDRIDEMSNGEYQAMLRLPGNELRKALVNNNQVLGALLAEIPDGELAKVLGDLGGHDFEELLLRLQEADADTNRPTVLFAYTIKGYSLAMAGHPLNHSMLLNQDEIDTLRVELGIGQDEWAAFAAGSAMDKLCRARQTALYPQPKRAVSNNHTLTVPDNVAVNTRSAASTQQSFGRILLALSREKQLAKHIVTVSPDVSSSTNLSGWINKQGVFSHIGEGPRPAGTWDENPQGQHIELGISEMNLFMALGMFGISAELINQLLIPIGTVYDPFVCRGLDAFIYGLYSQAKFIIAGTPSGVTLSPEGGAHQSAVTPSLGLELPNLDYYEPCFTQELAWILLEAIERVIDREQGRSSYLRLSTKPIDQTPFAAAAKRLGTTTLRRQVLAGGYRLKDWRSAEATDKAYLIHLVTTGAIIPEVLAAARELEEEGIPVNVINLTSPRRLYESWQRHGAESDPFRWLIPYNERHAPLIIINDGASHAHAWLGGVFGMPAISLGVDSFGQSGTRSDLYRSMGIDPESIVTAAFKALDQLGLG
ncbi:MAG: 1-deoxy-D-xylulose-5-phosphate synthase N-terminal domain-containing protein [Candidatus Promineifilaceae bacterium]